MAARGISSGNSQMISQGFTTALASAVFEWLLIFLLFIDAIFSYLVRKFAHYCELPAPCLLCSRLDHVLGNEKLGYYWDLICGNHKLEISSLVLCHVHNKLVDVHGMCENCLFSFATINKSNAETYRLLVGKLGDDPTIDLDAEPLLEGNNLGSSSTRHCSCCNEPFSLKGSAQKLLQTRSIGSEAAELHQPLSGDVAHYQSDLKNMLERPSGTVRASHHGNKGYDPLSHIGYTELKISSDTESEVLISDDDDASALVRRTNDLKEDFSVQCVQQEPRIITLDDDFTTEKLIDPASESEPSLLVSQVQSELIKPHGESSAASTVAIGHGLEELNWQQDESKVDPSSLAEHISIDDVLPSSNDTETPAQVLKESLDVVETGEVGKTSVTEDGEIPKAGSGPITITENGLEMKSDLGMQMPNYLDLGDAYKIAVSNRGRQFSGVLAEQWTVKDSSRVSEDLKLLLSQISATRGIELSLNDMSPRVPGNGDELKTSEASSSIGLQILQKRISLERNESGLSLDGSIVSEIEGESMVDRLKRQIEYDRKSMTVLYKELEEERNASAIAANQAMAMITRLQEEKAALHMEALQYLRMMEEQAEYDMEALQKSNDHLAEKEREVQELEMELELYRKKFPNRSMLENIVESTCDLKATDTRVEHSEASCVEDSANVARNSHTEKPNICHKIEGDDIFFGDKSTSTLKNSLLDFEDERLYILECLKKLEKKLYLFSNNGGDLVNGEYSGNEGDGLSDLKELNCKVGSQENTETEEKGFSIENDLSASDGSVRAQEGCVPSSENPHIVGEQNSEFDCGGQRSSMICRETDLVSLGNEVSDLNDRLEALEADRNFLEHSINSIRNGDEGLHFIQEIASDLRELRRIGIRRRDEAVA
ncbi:hypothetical protein L1049_020988 [Liquidambar formosana]|uniref:GTD-binding domain-containing protein n=1 Tax=Liquidambar formosana TaxID=63359 RepID=A0AAP0X4S5_LIQFO